MSERLRESRRLLALATAVVLATLSVAGSSGAASRPALGDPARIKPVLACGRLTAMNDGFSRVPDAAAYIFSASQVKEAGIAFCVVSGYIAPQDLFQIFLPVSAYTGQYLQMGCGGLCGVPVGIGGPSATAAGQAAAARPLPAGPLLVGGGEPAFALDNQGHLGGEQDALWASDDPALRLSFGYTSEHALARVARAIITAYYGKPPTFSYYDGCSGGGREALVEAQRYPTDFNGILAGAPAGLEAQLLGVVPAWVIDVNTGGRGREILGSEKLPALHAAVIKACGNAHGLIDDPRSCGFNPAAIECRARTDSSSCLTPAQVRVVRDLYLGPSDGHGRDLYPGGEPYGSELAWTPEFIDPFSDPRWPFDTPGYQIGDTYLRFAAYWHNPAASFQLRDFRFTRAAYRRLLPLASLYDATDPDLSAFARDGGKLIIYQGWADQAISPFGTVSYYHALTRLAGGFAASQRFARLYLVPGQYHCLNGGSPQVTSSLLNPLIRWVERGTAPGTVSFPLVRPTSTWRAIAVHPFNPLRSPSGGARGLNTAVRWIGRFQPGTELWCQTIGKNLVCTHSRLG